jgi:hypothetical protein
VSIMINITIRGAEIAAGFHSACQSCSLSLDIRIVLLYISMIVTILKFFALLGLYLIRSLLSFDQRNLWLMRGLNRMCEGCVFILSITIPEAHIATLGSLLE